MEDKSFNIELEKFNEFIRNCNSLYEIYVYLIEHQLCDYNNVKIYKKKLN